MKTIRLCLGSEFENHDVDLVVAEKELAVLSKFLKNVERLFKAKIFESGFPSIKNIEWTAIGGLAFEVSDFDYSQVCEFLHLSRPNFLNKEPASFEKAQAAIGKSVTRASPLGLRLKDIREQYEHGDYEPYFQVSVNGTPLFHDSTIKIWLNGVEYHQDTEKADLVARLEKALTEPVVRGIFVAQLSGRLRAIVHLQYLAKLIVQEPQNEG